MSNEESNIATCPFCGSNDVMIGRDWKTNAWYMECFSCKMSTKKSDDDIHKEVLTNDNR